MISMAHSQSNSHSKNIYTVSRLNGEVRSLLEGNFGRLWLNAEISNFVAPSSGHWYFTLKDARSQIRCAMFRGKNRSVRFRPENGQQVLVRANLSVYEPRGDYQLLVDMMDVAGDGLLQQQFEQLKCQLAAEGLFATENKQPLPEAPKRIGLITSPTGAAVRDMLTVLKRRNSTVEVVIYPTQVQGQMATMQIVEAIHTANTRREVDLLIVGRGGGSLEDLWCFNEEAVARAIAASQLPVISAVGHEVDVTIADFVADLRAPTPSAAAELAVDTTQELHQRARHLEQRLHHALRHQLSTLKQQQQQWSHRLESQHPRHQLQRQSQRLDELSLRLNHAMVNQMGQLRQRLTDQEQRLNQRNPASQLIQLKERHQQLYHRLGNAMKNNLVTSQQQLQAAMSQLHTVSPLATLERGYSISYNPKGKVLRDSQNVQVGDQLVTQLANGRLTSTVESVD